MIDGFPTGCSVELEQLVHLVELVALTDLSQELTKLDEILLPEPK
jgi:hypothetical protein